MTVAHAQAHDNQSTSSVAFADVPNMSVTATAEGAWAVFFSCVLRPRQPSRIELQVTENGVVIAGSQRTFEVHVMASQPERVLTLETIASPGLGNDVRVQWRVVYGEARVGDRRLTLVT